MKVSSYMTENLIDPKTAFSHEPTDTAFNLAFDTPESYFTWLGKPENAYRRARFDAGMPAIGNMEGKDSILRGI